MGLRAGQHLRGGVLAATFAALAAWATPADASPYGPEYDAAFEAMFEDPTNLDVTFDYAVIARRVGDLEGAVGALERMLIFNPNLPVVHYELAQLYAALGSHAAARRYYLSALDLAPPDDIRARIEAALVRLERAAAPSRWSGSLFAGLRWQDNANAAPEDGRVLIGGIDARLDADSGERSDAGVLATASLDHRYDLGRDPAVFWHSRIFGYAARQHELRALDLALITFDSGPEFRLQDDLTIRPFLIVDHVALDSSGFYRSFGLGGELVRESKSGWRWSVEAEALRRDHRENSRFPTLDDRDGSVLRLGAELGRSVGPDLLLTGSAGVERQDSRRGFESYRGGEIGLRLLKALEAPLGEGSWNAALNGRASQRDYDSADATIDAGRERRDRGYSLGLSVTVPLANGAAWTVEARQQWRRSNLPNFAFTDTTVSSGVRYNF